MTFRPELEAPTDRIARLPIDERGYPVPWFVAWVDGKPEFRAADRDKWRIAINEHRCWVCGERRGAYTTFVVGPMCGINRISAEPGSHRDCARWSVRNCPFLSRPTMVRREDDEINAERLVTESAGIALARNPGVTLLWTTKTCKVVRDPSGKPLIMMGEPTSVEWFREGRAATHAEVGESIETGFPSLLAAAESESDGTMRAMAVDELRQALARLWPLLPPVEAKS